MYITYFLFIKFFSVLLTKLSTNLFTALPQASSTTLGFAQNLAKNKAHALPFSSMALSVPNIFLPFKGIAQNTNNLLVGNKQILIEQNRSVVKFSWKRGTRKSVKVVTKKFFRLHW